MINVSIVLYNNYEKEINELIERVKESNIVKKIIVIDNSEKPIKIKQDNKKLEYIFNSKNLGFGKAHNIALQKSINENVNAHLILNPDIKINAINIEKLYDYLNKNKDVGIVVPKVIYENGNIQYLSKLLPSPKDLIFRRFLKFFKLTQQNNIKYELIFTGYNKIMEIGVASGSCMMIKIDAIKRVGLFDERFFMYLEDYDLSRRIGKFYKIVFYPEVEIIHKYEMHSYKNLKMLFIHVISAIKYFNKWGWFFDEYRKKRNKEILNKLGWKNG